MPNNQHFVSGFWKKFLRGLLYIQRAFHWFQALSPLKITRGQKLFPLTWSPWNWTGFKHPQAPLLWSMVPSSGLQAGGKIFISKEWALIPDNSVQPPSSAKLWVLGAHIAVISYCLTIGHCNSKGREQTGQRRGLRVPSQACILGGFKELGGNWARLTESPAVRGLLRKWSVLVESEIGCFWPFQEEKDVADCGRGSRECPHAEWMFEN